MADAAAARPLADRALVLAYRAASVAVRGLPEGVARRLAQAAGATVARRAGERRSNIASHLRRVDPELSGPALDRVVEAAFASYARYYVESFRLPGLSDAVVEAGFGYEGFGLIEDALCEGKGVILALPHLGGWEWAGRWLAQQGFGVTVVVEPLQPPALYEWFARLREDLGMRVVPLGPAVTNEVMQALRRNDVVCLLSDRDIAGNGIEVDLFGERTRLPAGPAVLSLRAGAPVLPTAVYFTGTGHHAVVRPAVRIERTRRFRADVEAFTQLLAVELEWLVRQAPQQWHLFQPNWPSDPGYGG